MAAPAGFTYNMLLVYQHFFTDEDEEIDDDFIGYFQLGCFALNRLDEDDDDDYNEYAKIINNWDSYQLSRRNRCVEDMIDNNRDVFEDVHLYARGRRQEESDSEDDDNP